MKHTRWLFVPLLWLLATLPAMSQQAVAPNITGMSVQGVTVDLNNFREDKNVVVLFYRMHS